MDNKEIEKRMKALNKLQGIFKEEHRKWKEKADKAWNDTGEELKLLLTSYIFDRLLEHFNEGGTYRCLIYDRLGFDMSAYMMLMSGLDLSNYAYEIEKLRGGDHDGTDSKE